MFQQRVCQSTSASCLRIEEVDRLATRFTATRSHQTASAGKVGFGAVRSGMREGSSKRSHSAAHSGQQRGAARLHRESR
jgi:hypothetical protein